MKGYIYRAYLPSGISYIGQTIDLHKRKKNHFNKRNDGSVFHVAIKLFGIEGFTWDILEECDEKYLNDREIYWIEYFDSCDNGFNSDKGGGFKYTNRHHTEEYLKRMSEINKNKIVTEETKIKLSKSLKGKTPTEETRKKLKEKRAGKTPALGVIPTQETRDKISTANRGSNNGMYGKPGANKGTRIMNNGIDQMTVIPPWDQDMLIFGWQYGRLKRSK